MGWMVIRPHHGFLGPHHGYPVGRDERNHPNGTTRGSLLRSAHMRLAHGQPLCPLPRYPPQAGTHGGCVGPTRTAQ